MKTSSITRGAMSVAMYGLLLLLNQQTGLAIESALSWVFILPVLIYTAREGIYSGLVTGLAMAVLTFLFGSFTTWFYSWSAILIGFIYGVGVYSRKSHVLNFTLCFLLSVIMYIFMVMVWSAIFGFDLREDFAFLAKWVPFLDFQAFLVMFVLFMAFLQALCVHLLAILVCRRLRIGMRELGSLRSIHSYRWVGLVSPVIWLFFFFGQNVIEYSIIQTTIQILFYTDCMVLAFLGAIVLMEYGLRKGVRRFTFVAIIGAFIPVVQLVWIALGELDCLISLRENWDLRG